MPLSEDGHPLGLARPLRSADQAVGCLVGLALGDAFGAPREGGLLERAAWTLIGRTADGRRRWTDDTAMSLAIAESLLDVGAVDQDDLARRFALGYRWSRGYGRGVTRVLKRIRKGAHWRDASRSVFPEGSYGNGAAMRSPVLAIALTGSALLDAAADVAVVTHGHPAAIEGARLVAAAVDRALHGDEPASIVEHLRRIATLAVYVAKLNRASTWLAGPEIRSARVVRAELGCRVAALDSCVTAIYLGLSCGGAAFGQLLARAAAVGGDVDTIGAMAGAIWGARNGASALPAGLRRELEDEPRIVEVAMCLHQRFNS